MKPIHACAADAVPQMVRLVKPSGLHFAFIDPYNLGALDFDIIKRSGETVQPN